MTITIHIADDHSVFRAGIRALIEKERDLEVIGESGNSFKTLELVRENTPQVLILDINMPGMTTSSILETIVKELPSVAILILTIHDEDYYLKEFLKAGARGFMVKTSTGTELIQAIRTVRQGIRYVDPSLSKHLISTYLGEPSEKAAIDNVLTRREKEIFEKLVHGYTNQEVAETLSISRRTVESHRASIMSKLDLNSRAELVRYAIQHGLFKPITST